MTTRPPKNARTAKESAARRARAARTQTALIDFYTRQERALIKNGVLELVESHESLARRLSIRSGNFSFEMTRAAFAALRNELKVYFEGQDDLPF